MAFNKMLVAMLTACKEKDIPFTDFPLIENGAGYDKFVVYLSKLKNLQDELTSLMDE